MNEFILILIYYYFQDECSIVIMKNASKQARNIFFHMQAKLSEGKLLKNEA